MPPEVVLPLLPLCPGTHTPTLTHTSYAHKHRAENKIKTLVTVPSRVTACDLNAV